MNVNVARYITELLLALDLLGVAVFALSGALAAVRSHLDAFGVLVLAYATALAGGITRDVLIGAVPPRRDQRLALPKPGLHGRGNRAGLAPLD